MKQHILLEKAFCYPDPIEVAPPSNCTFLENNGYWIDELTGKIMMLSANPLHLQTKKFERETGEDQKGQ